jgi:Ca2+/Na+ antiporter
MFNILVIVALSAAIAGKGGASLSIDYRPVSRDVGFYSYSILLCWLFFRDGEIELYEATVMWVSYLVYILFMCFNETILGKCAPPASDAYKISPEDQAAQDSAAKVLSDTSGFAENEGNGDAKEGGSDAKAEEEEEDGDGESRFALPETAADWPFYILGFPLLVLFTITIPDCATKKFEKYYVVSFFMSIMWIGVLCHVMVEFAVGVACILTIEPVIMGILVLAVGTSVPDAIGSMIAARNGEADMAIANAVGSNVFDVLLGLGFPWFLAIIIKKENFMVAKDGIIVAVAILFCTVLLFVGVLAFNKWQMNTNVGTGLFFLYFCYVVYTILSAA